MSCLNPAQLHTKFSAGTTRFSPIIPRCYTLTHSDQTGDLFLTIGPTIDQKQISGWYTRLMRDEVTAEWQLEKGAASLHLYCHVSGGFVFGSATMRYNIFRRELPLVLEAFRFGDSALYIARPELDQAVIWIHFNSTQSRYRKIENWGTPAKFK
ncbi:MAG: staygreen family protein [Anaerolineae bacterium]